MNNTENDYLPTDLGNVSLNPRGEYDLETAYEYLDTVSYQGGSYVCRVENGTTITGTAPEPGRNTDIWQLLTLPGDLRADYIAMHDDVVNKAKQVEISRAAVEQAQQEVEVSQADVQQLHEDTAQAAQEAENSRDSAAGYAQSAEQSRKAASESEQNINAQMTGLNQKVSELVTQATGDIAAVRQQAIDTITTQEDTSTEAVKQVGNAVLESAEQALQKLNTAGQQAVRAVTDQQNTSIQVVKDETKSYIEEKKQEISDKTDEVTQTVNQAGEKQLQNIANSLDSTLTESGKAADSKAVGDAIASVEESKANKSALETTDRKLDALWKLNQGITYEFQTDNTEAYQKEIPTGAKMASVKSIGGKTIVWNQLLKLILTSQTKNGCTIEVDENKHIKISGIPSNGLYLVIGRISFIKDHIYFINVNGKYTDENKKSQVYIAEMNLYKIQKTFVLCDETKDARVQIAVYTADTSVDYDITVTVFDLTKMFGAGNEPSTVEEFEAMFSEDYYPYNEGTLLSIPVNEVVEQGKNLLVPTDNLPKTDAGVIYTRNNDGTVICNGTSTAYSKMKIGNIKLNKGKAYILGSNDVRIVKEENGTRRIIQSGIGTFTASENVDAFVEIALNINTTYNNFIVKPYVAIRTASYTKYHRTSYPIPQEIFNLPGYGWATGDVCNEVDWENKKYIQRVEHKIIIPTSIKTWGAYFAAMVDIKFISYNGTASNYMVSQSVPQVKNGIMLNAGYSQIILNNVDFQNGDDWIEYLTKNPIDLYYEIDPLVTDLSDIIPEGFLEALEVEPGGTLTFQNSNGDGYKVSVPNTVEYAVKLSEVAE